MLNTIYLFIYFAAKYLCFSRVNMLKKCLEPFCVLAKSHQCPWSTKVSLGSALCHNRSVWQCNIQLHGTLRSPCHTLLGVQENCSASTCSNFMKRRSLSFLKLYIRLYICRPTYIEKVVKIAFLSDDLTVGILNLNDDMIEFNPTNHCANFIVIKHQKDRLWPQEHPRFVLNQLIWTF